MEREVKVKLRQIEPGMCGPLLATFLQGPPPSDSLFPPLASSSDRDLKFVYSADARRPGRGLLAGSSEFGIEFSARSTETSSSAAGYK